MTNPRAPWGAMPEDWAHFALILGLQRDLLPVVSNPDARISPDSKMQALGKTPSRYNRNRCAVGVPQWTQYEATDSDIATWSQENDYGICLQTRTIRALDIDVSDTVLARAIVDAVALRHRLPARTRQGTGKCLLAFRLPGDYPKRAFKTEGGIVEFLATGQQFVAVGTHPSGTRYEWLPELPDEIPEITPEQFEALWASLVAEFAIEAPTTNTGKDRRNVLAETTSTDPIAVALTAAGLVQAQERDGRLHITCPFAEAHTCGESQGSSTTYFPAHTGGYERGHFSCLHASCADRTDANFLDALGLGENPADDFELLGEDNQEPRVASKFQFQHAAEFASGPPPRWILRDLIPEAELVVVFGAPASGKSFFVLDACLAVAQGSPWRDQITPAKGTVAYVCAEGSGGFRNRINAYAAHRNTDLAGASLYVLGDGPNFTKTSDISALIGALNAIAPVSMVVVDTLSRVMVGADENSGQDMGTAIAACKALHKATRATVVLIHHSGKDSSKGSRGHSSLLGAADAEIEIVRDENNRAATLTKMKDGQEGVEYGFKLLTVKLGVDEDMHDITSCVVEPTAKALAKTGKKIGGTRSANAEDLIRGELDRLLAEGMGADNFLSYSSFVQHCNEALAGPVGNERDDRPARIKRAIDSLTAKGEIAHGAGKIGWAPSREDAS